MALGFGPWSSGFHDFPICCPDAVSASNLDWGWKLKVWFSPEILRMSELNDSSDLHTYSSAVLYILSAVSPPIEYVEAIFSNFVSAIKSTTVSVMQYSLVLKEAQYCFFRPKSWRTRLQALPTLVVFFYRNLLYISQDGVSSVMEVLMECLADENVEVREMASKTLAGVVRCSQRQSIIPLKVWFSG